MESDELLHELTGVGMAPALDTPSMSGLAPHTGVQENRVQESTFARGFLCLLPHCTHAIRYAFMWLGIPGMTLKP